MANNLKLNTLQKAGDCYIFRFSVLGRYSDVIISKREMERNEISPQAVKFFAAKLEVLALSLSLIGGRRE